MQKKMITNKKRNKENIKYNHESYNSEFPFICSSVIVSYFDLVSSNQMNFRFVSGQTPSFGLPNTHFTFLLSTCHHSISEFVNNNTQCNLPNHSQKSRVLMFRGAVVRWCELRRYFSVMGRPQFSRTL